MSILSTSSNSTRHFDMNIAAALGDINAAVILQQLHYWTQKEGIGVIINKAKYIYNTFEQWVKNQFTFLSVWKFRNSMGILRSLSIVEVIRYKSKQWNQTNYYKLNYKRLREWAEAESIEISEMWSSPSQGDESQTLEVRDSKLSINETKNNTKESTTKQKGDRFSNKSDSIAAASLKNELEEEKEQKQRSSHKQSSTVSPGQNEAKLDSSKSNTGKEKRDGKVDYRVNKELLSLLDSTGIPINKTVKDLLKLYSSEKVEGAIALVKARKRESHIPNPSGYFVAALKGDWASKNVVNDEGEGVNGVDKAAVFRHWYDLARELGYCSGTEVRDGERWINLSGAWETWSAAVERGYSLEYLQKIMKRNQSK